MLDDNRIDASKVYLFCTIVIGLVLIWAISESLSMNTGLKWPTKLVLYVLGFIVIAVASLGLQNIRMAISEDYYDNKPQKMLAGVTLYTVAFFASMSFGTHNLYYFVNINNIREAELNDLHNTMTNAKYWVAESTDNYIKKMENAINSAIDNCEKELINPDKPGAGEDFKEKKKILEAHLGGHSVEIKTDARGIVTSRAVRDFVNDARSRRDDLVNQIKSTKKEMLDRIEENQNYKDILSKIENALRNTGEVDDATTNRKRLIINAYKERKTAFDGISGTLNIMLGNDAVDNRFVVQNTPQSERIETSGAFWADALGGQLDFGPFLWSVAFAIFLEIGFVGFYYFGYLKHKSQ